MTNKHKPGGKKSPLKLTNKSPQQQNPNPSSTANSSTSGLDPEAEDKFELELYWCIQQLELGINSGKLNEKQMRSTQKNLDTLKSDKIALVQKRQLMRNTFGDYRAKMIQEEKKHGKTLSSVKLSTPKPNDNKSIFIKKAQTTLNTQQSSIDELSEKKEKNISSFPTFSTLFNEKTSNQPFVFNFCQPDE